MNIFYQNNFRKIIIMHLLENDYDLNKYSVESLTIDLLRKDNRILNALQLIISDTEAFSICGKPSIELSSKTNVILVTASELFDYFRATKDKQIARLLNKNFPDSLLTNLIDEGLISKANNRIKDPNHKVERDRSFSVFYYDALEEMESFLARATYVNKSTKWAELMPLTTRLFIPKEDILYLLEKGLISYKNLVFKEPALVNHHLIYEGNRLSSNDETDRCKQLTSIGSELYLTYNDESYLPSNSVYSTVLTMTISQWSKVINHMAIVERDRMHPVFSSIYLFLNNMKTIQSLFDVDMQSIKTTLEG